MTFTTDFSDLTAGDQLDASPDWTVPSGAAVRFFPEAASDGGNIYLINGRDAAQVNDTRVWLCPDQGSADHYVQGRLFGLNDNIRFNTGCVRVIDDDNYVFWYASTGSAGLRMATLVGGNDTDRVTTQGVEDGWYRVEAEGHVYTFYSGGNGAAPGTWTEIGSWTDTGGALFGDTETSMGIGCVASYSSSFAGESLIQDFAAGALGGGSTTVGAPLQTLSRQFATIAAARLGGVLQ
jgi:hypothetical protein